MISSSVARARDGVIPLLGKVSCIRATASKKRIKLIVTSHGLHHLESGDEKVLESQIGTARIFGKWIHVDIVAIEKKQFIQTNYVRFVGIYHVNCIR